MLLRIDRVLVLEVLLAVTQRTTQLPTVVPFCFEGDCYIKPDTNDKTWIDAQQMCRRYNSTLPIADNPDRQRNIVAALYNFGLNGTTTVWLGANATDYGTSNWRWLDGRQYSGMAVQDAGAFSRSYAVLSKPSSQVLAIASESFNKFYYICEYAITVSGACKNGTGGFAFIMDDHCYVKYSEKLTWFNSRSNCLTNKGDLASFSNISLLDGIVDTNGSWIGLRYNDWRWQDSLSGLSSEVTFTSWSIAEPNDVKPSCICIYARVFPNWIDLNCTNPIQYVCQVSGTTSVNSYTTEQVSPGNGKSASPYLQVSGQCHDSQAVAVGVGIGIPCCVVIISLAVVVIVLHRKLKKSELKIGHSGTQIAVAKGSSAVSSPTSAFPNMVEHDAKGQYSHPTDRSELQEERQYEQLQEPYYEPM